MTKHFQAIFRQENSEAARAKFLSRVFGIFSEEIVALWASDERAPYKNLAGRPTLRTHGERRGFTLDFLLQDRSNGKRYVTEMKCEIEYQNFRYFVLQNSEQLDHHKKDAFDAFLRSAQCSSKQTVLMGGREMETNGAILIWGAVTPEGRNSVMARHGLHDVLSIADICRDLNAWQHEGYIQLVNRRRDWCNSLFDGLIGESLCEDLEL